MMRRVEIAGRDLTTARLLGPLEGIVFGQLCVRLIGDDASMNVIARVPDRRARSITN